MPDFLTLKDAAKHSGYHQDYIGQLIRDKKVSAMRVGKSWLVDRQSLTFYLSQAGKVPLNKEILLPKPLAPKLPPRQRGNPLMFLTGLVLVGLMLVSLSSLDRLDLKNQIYRLLAGVRFADFSKTINYQGKLRNVSNNQAVADASYNFTFRLYQTLEGGSPIWTEGQTVTTANGLFSVALGASSTLVGVNLNQPLYLSVQIGADDEMSPRKLIGAVPSAIVAEQLNGHFIDEFVLNNATSTITASSVEPTITINQTGSGNVFDVKKNGISKLVIDASGNIILATTTLAFTSYIGDDKNNIEINSFAITGGELAGSNLPIIYGYGNMLGSKTSIGSIFYNGVAVIEDIITGQVPSLGFASHNDIANSNINSTSIDYATTTDSLLFRDASGGYFFDNDLDVTGTTTADCFTIDGVNCLASGGTVSSVDMTVPTGLTISGNPITTSGTLALGLDPLYTIPAVATTSNWNLAFGWGNHGIQGYLNNTIFSSNNNWTATNTFATTTLAFDSVIGSSTDRYLKFIDYLAPAGSIASGYHFPMIKGYDPISPLSGLFTQNNFGIISVDGESPTFVLGSASSTAGSIFTFDPSNNTLYLGGFEVADGEGFLKTTQSTIFFTEAFHIISSTTDAELIFSNFPTDASSTITHRFTTDQLSFSGASGGYFFDNDLEVTGTTTTSNLAITNLADTFLSVNQLGQVIATTSPLLSYTETDPLYTTASSTLLRFGTSSDVLIEGITNRFYTDTKVGDYLVASSSFLTYTNYWTRSGNDLNYLAGRVGIGITPTVTFEVLGIASSTGLQINGNATTTGFSFLSTTTMAFVSKIGSEAQGYFTVEDYDLGTIPADTFGENDPPADMINRIPLIRFTSPNFGLNPTNVGGMKGGLYILEDPSVDNNPVISFASADMISGLTFNTATIEFSTSTGVLQFVDAPNGYSFHTLTDGGTVYSEAGTGVITNTSPSSQEYKNNITTTDLDLEAFLGLQVKSFVWNRTGQADFGLIAEEIKAVLPELYSESGNIKGYRQDHLPFYLLQIAQRQEAEIRALKTSLGADSLKVSPDGQLVFKSIKTDNLISENGVTIRDRGTGNYTCIFVENGAIETSAGECSLLSRDNDEVSIVPPVVDPLDEEGPVIEEASSTPPIEGQVAGSSTENLIAPSLDNE